jgi:V/A-type H+/Na+-transporting ATPase subunit I
MAIVDMNRISIIGLQQDKDAIMENLMKMGVVDLVDLQKDDAAGKWSGFAEKDGDNEQAMLLETQIDKVRSAIQYLSRYRVEKKGLFALKRVLSPQLYSEIIHSSEELFRTVVQIGKYDEQLAALKLEENRLGNLISTLQPWKNLTLSLHEKGTRHTTILLGVIPSLTDAGQVKTELGERVAESCLEILGTDRDQSYLAVIYYSPYEEDVLQVLKKYAFSRVSFSDMTGTVQENIGKANEGIRHIAVQRQEIERNMEALTGEKGRLETLYDYLVIERDRKRALERMVKTSSTFFIEGWLPARNAAKVENRLTGQWTCMVDVKKPEKEEDFPILLENHPLVEPFELITQLYSLPSSKGIDPNLFMAPFYFLFFGMMVSDAGYGLVIAVATGIILWKFKLEGLISKLVKLLCLGGISTFIWGALFGGWFGNIVDAVTQNRVTIPPLWFNPLDDPMRLLIWSFIFGGVHLYVGLGLKAYMLIREGKVLDAVFDIGSWYVLLTGLVLLGLGGSTGPVGTYMSIGGAVLLVLTQGRNEKNVLKKLLSGVLSLYNVTGFLSDVLSYSRLLALGLATGVIANVVNTMGTLFGMNILGIIILVIVFIGGHGFNILINALGAYVHASRLQYVEFFGKFYESGGKAYKPFRMNTKYVDLKE